MTWRHVEDKTVQARTAHACLLCGEPIEPGQVYLRRFGFGEDGPVSAAMHPECERLTDDWDQMDWETFSPGDLDRPAHHPPTPAQCPPTPAHHPPT